jgi:hypothetical protein
MYLKNYAGINYVKKENDHFIRVVDPDWFFTDPDPGPAFLLNPAVQAW